MLLLIGSRKPDRKTVVEKISLSFEAKHRADLRITDLTILVLFFDHVIRYDARRDVRQLNHCCRTSSGKSIYVCMQQVPDDCRVRPDSRPAARLRLEQVAFRQQIA